MDDLAPVTPPVPNASSIPSLVGKKWRLKGIELLETLERDNRPSFIISYHEKTKLEILWFNPQFSRKYSSSPPPPATRDAESIGHGDRSEADSASSSSASGVRLDGPLKDWVLGRLIRASDPKTMELDARVDFTICPKRLLWSYTLIEQNGAAEWMLFTGIPLGDATAGIETPEPEGEKGVKLKSLERLVDPTPVEATKEKRLQRFLENQQNEQNNSEPWGTSDSGASTARPKSAIERGLPDQRSNNSIYDWTRLPIDCDLPPHIKLLRCLDWTKTPLGDIAEWPQSLRTLCSLMTSCKTPVAMFLGKRYTVVYNQAYIQVAGSKHPRLMGQDFRIFWSELWEGLRDAFNHVYESGETLLKVEDLLFLERHGWPEECYFSWSVIPMYGEDGNIVGLLNQAFELTRRVVAERRMLTLQRCGEKTSSAPNVKEFWANFIEGLDWNKLDTPFALLYSRQGDLVNRSESSRSSNFDYLIELEGSLGLPNREHKCAPEVIDLRVDDSGFAKAFRACHLQEFLLVDVGEDMCPHELLDGLNFRGFGDRPKKAVVCPVYAHGKEDAATAYLVVGINPRRPFDEDYSLFIQLLTRQLTTSLGTVLLFQAEVRRNQQTAKLAAMEKVMLSEQLASRTKEAQDSDMRFARLAEVAPVGIFLTDSHGRVTFTNDTFYDITQHSRDDPSNWMDSVHPDCAEKATNNWRRLLAIKEGMSEPLELRWKMPFVSLLTGDEIERWTLASYFVEKDDSGNISSLFGVMTNISEQKFSENTQRRRWEAATELKRQQDNFVDMASHEMRNPLSAILLSSDHIISSLNFCRYHENLSDMARENLTSCVDAAQTILLCATHQSRVVDDILTLSKLDSTRLSVTPVDVQPEYVVRQALGMFEQESLVKNIQMSLEVEPSYNAHEVGWIRLDPTRLLQVLINLITNALKFVRKNEEQSIKIKIGASKAKPEYDNNNLVFMRAGTGTVMQTPQAQENEERVHTALEKGDPNSLYLMFEVQDNGKGMTKEEMNMLFQRFNQATPRTHVQYGGSGLGLFICRELVSLQNGAICVSSEAGKGTSFHFYIVVQRGLPPEDENHLESVMNRTNSIPPKSPGISGLRQPSISHNSSTDIASAPITTPRSVSPEDMTLSIPPTALKKSPAVERLGLKKTRTMPVLSQPKISRPYEILIVEDNIVNQKVVQRQLQSLGCTTFVANHGQECLDIIERSRLWDQSTRSSPAFEHDTTPSKPPTVVVEPFDVSVVLMDIEMPVMDGLTATREIRRLQRENRILSHVPIIAVTANARPEQMKVMLEAGVDDILSKPFRIPELVAKLEQVVGGDAVERLVKQSDVDSASANGNLATCMTQTPTPPTEETTAKDDGDNGGLRRVDSV